MWVVNEKLPIVRWVSRVCEGNSLGKSQPSASYCTVVSVGNLISGCGSWYGFSRHFPSVGCVFVIVRIGSTNPVKPV